MNGWLAMIGHAGPFFAPIAAVITLASRWVSGCAGRSSWSSGWRWGSGSANDLARASGVLHADADRLVRRAFRRPAS